MDISQGLPKYFVWKDCLWHEDDYFEFMANTFEYAKTKDIEGFKNYVINDLHGDPSKFMDFYEYALIVSATDPLDENAAFHNYGYVNGRELTDKECKQLQKEYDEQYINFKEKYEQELKLKTQNFTKYEKPIKPPAKKERNKTIKDIGKPMSKKELEEFNKEFGNND